MTRQRIEPTFSDSFELDETILDTKKKSTDKYERENIPFGLVVLCLLALISGFVMLISPFLGINRLSDITEGIGVSDNNFLIQMLTMGVVYLISAFLIVRKNKWGWLLIAFVLIHGLVGGLNQLGFIAEYSSSGMVAVEKYYAIFIKMLVYLLLVLYLFKRSVLEYIEISRKTGVFLLFAAFTLYAIYAYGNYYFNNTLA